MAVITFIKAYNLDYNDSINILKRIERVSPNFYNQEINAIDMNHLEQPKHLLLLLETRFSLLTTIRTISLIIKLYNYYLPDSDLIKDYEEIENDLLGLYENPNSYSKITYGEIESFLHLKVVEFTRKDISYTKVRNLLLVALLSQYPMTLNELINIKYVCFEGADFEETFPSPIAILKRDCEFYFIKNGKTILEQEIKKIDFIPLHRCLTLYLSKFKRGLTLLSGIKGFPLTKSNISNGLINFTRSEFGFPLSIHDIRQISSTS